MRVATRSKRLSNSNWSRRRSYNNIFTMFIAGSILVGTAIFLASPVIYIAAVRNSAKDISITVVDKERGSDSKATLIFADDKTYSVSDSLSFWHFNSSDVYRQLEVGNTYNCKVAGWRIPIISSYENIIECEGFN